MKKAWKLPGFVGAKLYPPMGFAAYGNNDDRDEALGTFYHECIRQDACVMAHAGPSLCVESDPCNFPGYVGWTAALKHVFDTEKEPLRVCLGHFGNVFGATAPYENWPEQFLAIMEQPFGQRLYADLSYANEVLDPSKDAQVRETLKRILTTHAPTAADRLMYGSDWLMLGLERDWPNYAHRMGTMIAQVEQESHSPGLAARFLGTNAREWLGLDDAKSLASRNSIALRSG